MTSRKLSAQLKKLESKVERLKPAPAPGILTSQTTRGVTRRPGRSTTAAGSTDNDTVPCWG